MVHPLLFLADGLSTNCILRIEWYGFQRAEYHARESILLRVVRRRVKLVKAGPPTWEVGRGNL